MSQDVDVFVLNHNGRGLLARCLPSVLRACRASRYRPRLTVIDNDSSDGSLSYLQALPEVAVWRTANRGLCSFNEVLAQSNCRAAVLLNNDIQLAEDSIDPLVAPLIDDEPCPAPNAAMAPCFLTAALCWKLDGGGYDGQKTAVRWRFGLVQATSLFPGHEAGILAPGRTASAGAAIAVKRRPFVELGGFDPLYLPGRLEDLDLAYRANRAGYVCQYVPTAVAWHVGMASFGPAFGPRGNEHLALRNTLLFQWRHMCHPLDRARQMVGFMLRGAADVLRAPLQTADRRWSFLRAWRAAKDRWAESGVACDAGSRPRDRQLQRRFFREFHPTALCAEAALWHETQAAALAWHEQSTDSEVAPVPNEAHPADAANWPHAMVEG